MDHSQMPPLIPVAFADGAASGYISDIPVQAQSETFGRASYELGFPPLTFKSLASGGVPPSGADFNGILNAFSRAIRWTMAGGHYPFDTAFSQAMGGYPKDAILMRADGLGQWLNTADGNVSDPDSGDASGWIGLRANAGITTIVVNAGDNPVPLAQLGAQVIVVTGTPDSAAKLVLPLTAGAQWLVVNNTGGTAVLQVGGATGAAVTLSKGVGIQVYTDGTRYYTLSAMVKPYRPGEFVMWCGESVPDGLLICDGRAVLRNQYSDLYAIIGTKYGPGDGSTTFNLPKVEEGQTLVGTSDPAKVGTTTQGAILAHGHSASATAVPDHTHAITVNAGGDHGHSASTNAAGDHVHATWADAQGAHMHSGSTSASGDHAHTQAGGTMYLADYGGQIKGGSGHDQHTNADGRATAGGGNHAHTFGTDWQGTHGHNIAMNGAGGHAHSVSVANGGSHAHTAGSQGAGGHNHAIAVNNTGGAANLPAGLHVLYCIAY